MSNNIDAFNVAVAEIFSQCYQEFPLRVCLSKMDIGEVIKHHFGNDPEGVYNLNEKEYQIAEETMKWLYHAGYIWSDKPNQAISFKDVTLTPKGLEVLNCTPVGLEKKEKLGDFLRDGVMTIRKEFLSSAIKNGLEYGTKIMAGGLS